MTKDTVRMLHAIIEGFAMDLNALRALLADCEDEFRIAEQEEKARHDKHLERLRKEEDFRKKHNVHFCRTCATCRHGEIIVDLDDGDQCINCAKSGCDMLTYSDHTCDAWENDGSVDVKEKPAK